MRQRRQCCFLFYLMPCLRVSDGFTATTSLFIAMILIVNVIETVNTNLFAFEGRDNEYIDLY